MLTIIILGFFYCSLVALILNNLTTIGFFLYTWSNGTTLAQALWDSFLLYISIGFIAGVVFLMSLVSMKLLDRASSRYSRK